MEYDTDPVICFGRRIAGTKKKLNPELNAILYEIEQEELQEKAERVDQKPYDSRGQECIFSIEGLRGIENISFYRRRKRI